MSGQMSIHNTVAPATAAGVSCVLGFDLHTALGYVGQVVGILSGLMSLAWIGYQMYRASKRP